MEHEDEDAPRRGFVAVVKRRGIVIVSITFIALAASLVYSFTRNAVFESEAQLLVQLEDSGAGTEDVRETLEGEEIRDRVIDSLGLQTEPAPVRTSTVGETGIFALRVRADAPETSATLANAYVDAYVAHDRQAARHKLEREANEILADVLHLGSQLNEIDPDDPAHAVMADRVTQRQDDLREQRIEVALEAGNASMLQPATPPHAPIERKPLRAAIITTGIGLLLGLLAAFVVDKQRLQADPDTSTSSP